MSIHIDLAAIARLRRETPALEKPGGPEPLVDADRLICSHRRAFPDDRFYKNTAVKSRIDREGARVIEALRRELEGRPEVLFAYLHGSFIEGGPYRDIDVAGEDLGDFDRYLASIGRFLKAEVT